MEQLVIQKLIRHGDTLVIKYGATLYGVGCLSKRFKKFRHLRRGSVQICWLEEEIKGRYFDKIEVLISYTGWITFMGRDIVIWRRDIRDNISYLQVHVAHNISRIVPVYS